jgi:comEA protein
VGTDGPDTRAADGRDDLGVAPVGRWPVRERIEMALLGLGVTPLQLVLGAVTLAAVAVIGWMLLRPPPVAVDARVPMLTVPPPPITTAPPVAVHVAGAVVAPGLYVLDAGARVADLVAAAGGVTGDADLDRVNLAAAVGDGWQVRVPRVGETPPPIVTPDTAGGVGGGAGVGPGSGGSGPGAIDLNRATAAELETLPGVGPAIAGAIVEHRDRAGGFRSVEELLDVSGIGPARLERLRDLVTVS